MQDHGKNSRRVFLSGAGLALLAACAGGQSTLLSPQSQKSLRRTALSSGIGADGYSVEDITNGAAVVDVASGNQIVWITIDGTTVEVGSDYYSQVYSASLPTGSPPSSYALGNSGITVTVESSTERSWTGSDGNTGSGSAESESLVASSAWLAANGGKSSYTFAPVEPTPGPGGGSPPKFGPIIPDGIKVKTDDDGLECIIDGIDVFISFMAMVISAAIAAAQMFLDPIADFLFAAAVQAYNSAAQQWTNDGCGPLAM